MTLMIGAGLLLKSFSRLVHVNPGFNPSHLLIIRTQSTRNQSPAQKAQLYAELREKLARLPGITSATTGDLPLPGGGMNSGSGDPFGVRGRSYDATMGPVTQFAQLPSVGIDYFSTLQIPLRAGRGFTAGDSTGEFPKAVIVNETLARAFFPQGAVGQSIGVPPPCRDTKCDFVWATIVGVVGDVKTRALDVTTLPAIYLPQPTDDFILRTAGEPLAMTHAAVSVIHSMASDIAVLEPLTMEDRISATFGKPQFATVLVAFFAGTALFLAAIGIFGVVAHSTAQRTHEIGIRIALGADGGHIIRTVMIGGIRPVAVGLGFGLAAALAFGPMLNSVLFQITATDPPSYVSAAMVLTLAAIAACLGPALRAMTVDPVVALREY
jgi:putative ABC transport system permease protein